MPTMDAFLFLPVSQVLIISLEIFRTMIIYLYSYPKVLNYNCVKFHQ